MFWMVALIVLVIVHRWVPQARWLMVHMATLGIAANSIMIWGQHFSDSVLRTRHDEAARDLHVRRLWVLNLGILVTVVGMVGAWPVVATVGATVVGLTFTWYALSLVTQARKALPSRFGHVARWYTAAALLLPLGAAAGAVMSFSMPEPWQGRLMVAHVVLNVLGFVGLTATATLLTLWPTMLRTPMEPWSEKVHRIALPLMLVGVLGTAGAATMGWRWATAAALLVWLAGFGCAISTAVATTVRKPPRDFPTWSVGMAIVWIAGCVIWLLAQVLSNPLLDAEHVKQVTAPLVVGGLVQLVLGAMSYLMPVVMGGGPRMTRATNAVMNRAGALRVTVANAGLVAFLLAETSWAKVVTSLLAFAALASFVPVMIAMVRTMRRVRLQQAEAAAKDLPAARKGLEDQAAEAVEQSRRDVLGAGVGLVGVAAAWYLLDRDAPHTTHQADVPPTGNTVEVAVAAVGMRFEPDHVQIAPGDRLVVTLTNHDPTQVHDLRFENGVDSGRLGPGQSASLDVGVVGAPLEGWCTIVGHRAMGMVFHVRTDATAAEQGFDLDAAPGAGFVTRDAVLPEARSGSFELDLVVQEVEQEVAPGWTQTAMTYNGRIMGPPIVAALDTQIMAHLTNNGTMGHSIDFHAGDVSPDEVMRTIPPGESLDYAFTTKRSGIWLYHCSTMPMTAHVAAGMYGAVVVPPRGLAAVDREYLLVQQEAYLGPNGGEVDMAKIEAETPDLVLWNGHANQYVHDPLTARVGERVRLWVLAAGPSRGTSFHVVGGQFDTVFKEGEWLLRPHNTHGGGAQALDLAPAQGGFVELVFSEPGTYTFVNHSFVEAERGARGIIKVS
ncbi:multicopper oxidase domain-containing protein [Propionibacteriaceae bacterium Y1923]|uniref:multicopper oxidase domain-containing protein n=1 Tax=Aestuariimicrobium sp. Y1814 TaxID=3418742 RepID=UPI003C27E9EF